MPAHFLLTARARTLSLVQIARMGDDEAHGLFREMRWPATNGEPVCPRCDCAACYSYAVRRLFKCKACAHQFTVTSGTIFASRKLPVQTYLLAIAIFVNAVKGVSALQLGRDLDVQYKTAFVLAHKLRETMAANQNGIAKGQVEIDGCYVRGSIRQENRKEDRIDRRLAGNQTGKRRVVVVMRERGGRTLPFVVKSEDEAVDTIRRRVEAGSTVYADEASAWDALHARYAMKRINHSFAFSDEGACTNQAESFFSRLRRAEWGSTTGSAATICTSTPARWRGVRTCAASTTAASCAASAWGRWRSARAGTGRGIGSGRRRDSPMAYSRQVLYISS